MRQAYARFGSVLAIIRRTLFIVDCCVCLAVGVVCAAPVYGGWYRAQLVQADEEANECDLRLVDIGGYVHMDAAAPKQIRQVPAGWLCIDL